MDDRTGVRSGNDDVRKFVERAAMADMAEVQLGQLALQQAQDPQVKQFAQQMVDAHSRSLEQLRSLASRQNIQLASSLDSKHQKRHDKLAKLQGAEFDRAYMDAMVDAHEDAEKLIAKRAGANASQSASAMSHEGASGASTSGRSDESGTAGAVGTSGSSEISAGKQDETSSSGTPRDANREAEASKDETSATAGASSSMGSGGVSADSTGTSGSTNASEAAMTPATVDAWAATALAKVRMHLEQARSLDDQVKKADRATGNSNNSGNSSGPGANEPATPPDDESKAGSSTGGSGDTTSTPPRQ
jgi:predicted outer membrane protein